MKGFIIGMLIVIGCVMFLESCATVPPENVIEFKENKICVYKPCKVG